MSNKLIVKNFIDEVRKYNPAISTDEIIDVLSKNAASEEEKDEIKNLVLSVVKK